MKKRSVFLIGFFIILAVSCVAAGIAVPKVIIERGAKIYKQDTVVKNHVALRDYPFYRSYSKVIKEFDKIKGLDKTTLDSVVYDKKTFNIYKYVMNSGAKYKVLIFAGTHGNEPTGVYGLLDFMQKHSSDSELKDVEITFVPVNNPWSFEHHCRFNREGYDTNRDYLNGSRTKEAKIIIDNFYYDKIKYDLIVDMHASIADGHYFFTYSKRGTALAREYIEEQKDSLIFADGYKVKPLETDNGVMYENWLYLKIAEKADLMALTNKFKSKSKLIFTSESSLMRPWGKRVEFHSEFILFAVKEIAGLR